MVIVWASPTSHLRFLGTHKIEAKADYNIFYYAYLQQFLLCLTPWGLLSCVLPKWFEAVTLLKGYYISDGSWATSWEHSLWVSVTAMAFCTHLFGPSQARWPRKVPVFTPGRMWLLMHARWGDARQHCKAAAAICDIGKYFTHNMWVWVVYGEILLVELQRLIIQAIFQAKKPPQIIFPSFSNIKISCFSLSYMITQY